MKLNVYLLTKTGAKLDIIFVNSKYFPNFLVKIFTTLSKSAHWGLFLFAAEAYYSLVA